MVIARGQSALFGDVDPQSALFRRMRLSSPGQTWRHLTEKRILQPAPHGKAHSARQQSPRVRLSVRVRPRVRFSVECVFPHLGKRDATSRKSAFSNRRLTEKRILHVGPHGKAHSARWASRESAFCTPTVTQSASFRESPPQSALFRRVRFSSPAQTWRRLTEKRSLQPAPHGKAHSARWASRESAFCTLGLTGKRILHANSHPECVFP